MLSYFSVDEIPGENNLDLNSFLSLYVCRMYICKTTKAGSFLSHDFRTVPKEEGRREGESVRELEGELELDRQ